MRAIAAHGPFVIDGDHEIMRALDKHNLQIMHLWGMTETTPLATVGKLKRHMGDWTSDQQYEVRAKQGWPAPFIELRVMRPEGPEEKSVEAPRDGLTPGELEVPLAVRH